FNLYGNISTSFDPPAIAELVNPDGPTGFNQSLDPQTATNYEVGFKGLGQDTDWGRLHYELALFHIDVQDEIVPYELNGAGQAFYRNAGRSSHNGIEAGVSAELVPGLIGRLAYTWSDFTFKDFSEPGSNGSSASVFDGNRIPGVPQNQAHFDLAWQPASGFYAGIDFLYVGPFFANNANTVETDAYFVSNLRTGYRWTSDAWSFEPFVGVSNLFDEAYMDNIRINATFGRYYEPAPERNIYAGAELRYGF
ncbi:MAG: TonB-dependent receptor domain-containing protein, partial [Lysobacterales bacterium]